MTEAIEHVTLNTADARRVPRSEIDEAAIDGLQPVVDKAETDGAAIMPTPDGEAVLRAIVDHRKPSRHVRIWAIELEQDTALVTFAVAMKSRPAAGLWRALHDLAARGGVSPATEAGKHPAVPYLATVVHLPSAAPAAGNPLSWLADAEQCIAWTWIERVYRRRV